jgi:hypothetical protein
MHAQRRTARRSLGLGLLAVLVALLVTSACGGGEKESKARPLPEDEKALRPGTYRSEEFTSPHSPSMWARDGQAHPWKRRKRPTTWISIGDRRRG